MCHNGEKKSDSSKWAYAFVVAASLAVIGLAVASSVLMATASQCTVYAAYGAPPRTVTYSDFRPFEYLVVANAIAAFLVAIAVFLSVWNKKGKLGKVVSKIMPVLGAAVPALLYTSTAAAFAANDGMMPNTSAYGKRISVCAANVAGGNFCRQVRLAIFLSLGAAVTVTIIELVKSLALSKSSGGGSDSDSDSDSYFCGYGCHSKH